MIALFNNEEIGSQTSAGANGNFLLSVLHRIYKDFELVQRASSKSFLISLDNAHAYNPNYTDKYDVFNAPVINNGPVLKYNSKHRYTIDSDLTTMFKKICFDECINVQDFACSNNIGSGSTLGPIISAQTGIRGIDVGVPTWSMHSIRETAGAIDIYNLDKVIQKLL